MEQNQPHPLIRNGLSYVGMPIAAFGFVAAATLIVMDMFNPVSNPYVSIFIYMIMPVIVVLGILLTVAGVIRERRRRRRSGQATVDPLPVINLNDRRQLLPFLAVLGATALYVGLSAVGGYRTYHFTESVPFCGATCHTVMEPEYTAFQRSPHANVHCTKCHIGPGADWFVKAKFSGIRQVFATALNTFSRPIEAPVHNLRPANETCYACHWPQKFFGAVELLRTYFRADEENSPWSIHMLIHVGGGDVEHGRKKGIHWHMALKNRIEYIATDEDRLEIPWVRVTGGDGSVTVYQTTEEDKAIREEDVPNAEIRTMDCIDCHNRPSHQFHSPERALNEGLASGALDPALPYIKANAVEALVGDYETKEEAMAAIREKLLASYPDRGDDVAAAIQAVQKLHARNFFPEMKVSWEEYPDHIGHMISPGCFRCHDGKHVDETGRAISRECNSCHTIIAQGPGRELSSMTSGGLEFQHPEDIDEEWKETNCDECHTGVPVM